MTDVELVGYALKARGNSYSPYSGFRVGAAVEMTDGKVFTGTNIENSSYGASNCAERTAVFTAVSNGVKRIKKIAIASDSNELTYPCGICRQVISEFSNKGTKIICAANSGEYKVYSADELLPEAFKLKRRD